MTLHNTQNNVFGLVEVPKDASEIRTNAIGNKLEWKIATFANIETTTHNLPTGTWQIFADGNNLTEELAAQIVGYSQGANICMDFGFKPTQFGFDTALQSFTSLLAHYNIQGRVVILKRISEQI